MRYLDWLFGCFYHVLTDFAALLLHLGGAGQLVQVAEVSFLHFCWSFFLKSSLSKQCWSELFNLMYLFFFFLRINHVSLTTVELCKLLDWDPEGWWFKPQCGQNKISCWALEQGSWPHTAPGGIWLLLGRINCNSLGLKIAFSCPEPWPLFLTAVTWF